ncbi:sugar ABC transporter permease [Salinispira pacifica]|uniref:Maltose/maltodextrin transport system permease protein MalG n=1 Tax=Salinispira pacifica TaxID=1307761 RepID=V5WJ28_9SPIO|nr:sugar ABC transporter permease [Salinispira pacifica]AHC15842.1 Maltose/maltodextrin ABC transporter, permease protein MalG [Salinispira pacifica]
MSDQTTTMKAPTELDLMKKYGFGRWFFQRARGDSPFKRLIIHIVLLIVVFIAVYPVLRIVTVSLRPGNRLLSTSLAIIPEDATFQNYYNVLFNRDFVKWLWNSLIITTATSSIGVMIASTSAYAFSRWNFPGRSPALIFLLATQMIPFAMLMIPIYIISARLGLINTWRGLVVAYSVSSVPFSIWILKGYYDSIPTELEQSAMVDGATRMQAFFRIILPLSTPALAIAFLFNFTQAWNDFLLARIMLQQAELYTWPLGLQSMQRQFQTQWGEFSAGALMVSVPVMILFLTSSRWLISGLTVGSVKG